MESASDAPLVIQFGRFQIVPHRRELLADGELLEVGGRAFDVLMALIEASGGVVSRDALMERVWPGRIVEENSLDAQIAALRKIFAVDRALIRTIARRGYQFTGEIRAASALPQPAETARTVQKKLPSTPQTNLPEQVSELIGRELELSQILDLSASRRLITLVGAGGIGKTRLSNEVAWRLLPQFVDGVWLVELAPLSDPDLVPVTIAATLGLELDGGRVSPERVAKALGPKQLMLVLDNCEQVVDAAARMAEAVLHANPATRVIATSREPLRAEGEWIFPVPPLAVPTGASSDTEDLLRYGAVRLFVERARAAAPHFSPDATVAAIGGICRRLDGIPLAIELAASRATTIGIKELEGRLDHRFDLLTGGRRTALPRQRTLRATLDWSYELLSEADRDVLRRLAIFPRSFGLEAAGAIMMTAGDGADSVLDSIAGLVAKSLVTRDVGSVPARYRLLETTRAYAREKLSRAGELEATARRHAEYFQGVHERERWARSTAEWLATSAGEIDNVRVALDWAFSPVGDTSIGAALTIASEPLWYGLSLVDEYRRRTEVALASMRGGVSQAAHREMQLCATLAVALFNTEGPGPEACAAWIDALAIAEELDDTEYRLRALWGLWYNRISNGECRAALALAQRFHTLPANQASPADLLVGERMLGTSLYYLGDLSSARGHLEHVLSSCTAALRRSHLIRFQFDLPVTARGTLARILWLQGLPDQAVRMAQGNVEDARAVDPGISISLYWALDCACMVALVVGDLATAESSLAMLLENSAKHTLGFWQALGQSHKGQLLIKRGDVAAGVQSLRASIDELRVAGYVLRFPGLLGALAEGLAGIGQVAQGLVVIDEALAECERTDERWSITELLRVKGELLLLDGAPGAAAAAEELYRQGMDWARGQGGLSWELRCAGSLARLWREQARSEEARGLLASVYQRFTEGFATADLKAAKALIDELS